MNSLEFDEKTQGRKKDTSFVRIKYDVEPIPCPIPEHLLIKTTDAEGKEIMYEDTAQHEVRIATIGNVDAGKCIGVNTTVYRADGTPVRAGDLDVGDEILGENHLPTTIKVLTSGKECLYKIFEMIGINSEGNTLLKYSFSATRNHKLTFMVKQQHIKEIGVQYGCHFIMFNPKRELDDLNNKQPLVKCVVMNTNFDQFKNLMETTKESPFYIKNNSLIDISLHDFLMLPQDVADLLYCVRESEPNKYETFNITINPPYISEENMEDYVGFEVDNPTNRFLIEDNILTHNSTTLGVLKSGELDNGKGARRLEVFRHQHEKESGRTSSVSTQHLFYKNRTYDFHDLAGHEMYLKTTVYGLNAVPIDWAMLIMGANQGIIATAKQHLGLALEMDLCLFVVVTKIDMTPPNILEENMKILYKMLKSKQVASRQPVVVNNKADLEKYYQDISTEQHTLDENKARTIVPIFQVSNVTGQNYGLFHSFIYNLRSGTNWKKRMMEESLFVIERTFSPPGAGLVLSGFVKAGDIKKGDMLYLGPYSNNIYYKVRVWSIRDNFDRDIESIQSGNSGCFGVKTVNIKDRDMVNRDTINKGMILTTRPIAVKRFKASIKILHHPTTIQVGYEPVLHCGSVQHTVKIIEMEDEAIRTGDKTNVTMEFKRHACFVEKGVRFIFREGATKGSGTVTDVVEEKVKVV